MAARSQPPRPGAKGYALEEALRNYFLLAGLYAVRGVPLRMEGDDITDVDLWLYERPSGSARRRLIVDAKFKNKPKAAERLLWTKGLSAYLGVEGAYVATTDSRPSVRKAARKIGLLLLDGTDLNRIAANAKTEAPGRLTSEEFDDAVRAVDAARYSKDWFGWFDDAKASLIEDFGAASANRALSALEYFAAQAAVAAPASAAACTAVRLSLFCASVAAVSLDYAMTDAAFRPVEDRRRLLINVIRYGRTEREAGLEKVRLASALLEQFIDNGDAVGKQILNRFEAALEKIPAEIIADHVARMTLREPIFGSALQLEAAAYDRVGRGFDQLPSDAKGLMGAFLDFVGVPRAKFADAANGAGKQSASALGGEVASPDEPATLFPTQAADHPRT